MTTEIIEKEAIVVEPLVVNGSGDEQKIDAAVTSTAVTSTSALVEEMAAPPTNGASKANGEKKHKKEKKEKVQEPKEPKEPPKALSEDPADWLKHHQGQANHKANYDLLAKIIAYVEEDESKRQPTVGKVDSVSNSQFVAAHSDGQLASKLVKKLSILAAVPIVEGEEELKKKENQTALLQAFVDYAKSEGGVSEEKVFSAADAQEGKKSAHTALFTTLVLVLGNKGVLDVDHLADESVKYAEENSISGRAKSAISQISHSISNFKLSLQRKKSAGEANGMAENGVNGVAENGVNGVSENGSAEPPIAPIGVNGIVVEEVETVVVSQPVATN